MASKEERKADQKEQPVFKRSWEGEDESKLSKNQLRKKRRWEKAMDNKKRRKQQEKEVRDAKAKAEGRDLEAERRLIEERRKEGKGHEKREQLWKERFAREAPGYQICIDCAFEESMTPKEVNSLAIQLRYCYSANRKSRSPATVHITSLAGTTLSLLQNVSGFEQWSQRAFNPTPLSIEKYFPDLSKVIYLTSDAEETVSSIEDDKIYCIGGIVDRNRLKRAAVTRAESLGLKVARLPLSENFDIGSTKVLTTNHVFEILVKFKELGDWKKAMVQVLPKRKDVVSK